MKPVNERNPEAQSILKGLWNLQGGRCAYCGHAMRDPQSNDGRALNDATIDHLVPVAHGGADTIENRVAACRGCNQDKDSLDVSTFIRCRHNPVMLDEARRITKRGEARRARR